MKQRRFCLKSKRTRLIFVFLSLGIVFFLHNSFFSRRSSILIVSLTTTPRRFQYELPITIQSLLSQTLLPKEIRIYLSPIFNRSNITLKSLRLKISSKNLFDEIVRLKYVDNDDGPATKFLPILRESHSDRNRPIIICDDDHMYQPYLVSTLNDYANKYPNDILGFRGWRIREDLNWGVSDPIEYSFHVVYSHVLRQPYRVGVITANSAYLIRPKFFDEKIYSNFSQIPDDIRHVDDIWLNGHAARRNISRFVIPSICPNLAVTRTHELENFFEQHHTSRSSANDRALQWFKNDWESNLWYRFHGENHPTYRYWFQTGFRESFCAFWKLKIIFHMGKIF